MAPCGAVEQFSGRLTVCLLLFRYVPLSVQLGFALAPVVGLELLPDCDVSWVV